MAESILHSQPSALPVNDLAAAYQPRRVWAAAISIAWNLSLGATFLFSGGAWKLYSRLSAYGARHNVLHYSSTVPAYLVILFAAYSALNFPLELWFGYLEERQFGLAKDGIRAWSRDWLAGVAQHGMMFFLGSSLLLSLQIIFPHGWIFWASLMLLALFLATVYLSVAMLPHSLFHLEPLSADARERLCQLVSGTSSDARSRELTLPPIHVFSAPHLREFSGGLTGLGNRQAILLSRSTVSGASDTVLKFVLLHDLGHRRYHHLLLATLAGWAFTTLGLCVAHAVILRYSPASIGVPPSIPWLATVFSLWMAAIEPLLAYLGRRLEYQADRFYLRNGGTVDEMRAALEELSRRNLARTEGLARRHTIFHPLPSVWNRLHAAGEFVASMRFKNQRTG